MRPPRGATGLAGVLLLDKPAGMTSHDVVSRLRAATGERRIGHAGTLDPLATGLLVVLVGRATRLEQYLVGHDKEYRARIAFGTATDTLDADGVVTASADVPARALERAHAHEVLARFIGPQQQVPPAYSAIKRDGVASHRLARRGEAPVLEPRPIMVRRADLTAIDPETRSWDVEFEVSKGTYIRALVRDIGIAAGTVAHLVELRRTRAGSACVEFAHSLEDAVAAAAEGRIDRIMTDPVQLLGFPAVAATPEAVRDGRPLPAGPDAPTEGALVSAATDAELLGVYCRSGDLLVPDSVYVPGIPR